MNLFSFSWITIVWMLRSQSELCNWENKKSNRNLFLFIFETFYFFDSSLSVSEDCDLMSPQIIQISCKHRRHQDCYYLPNLSAVQPTNETWKITYIINDYCYSYNPKYDLISCVSFEWIIKIIFLWKFVVVVEKWY